MVTKVKIVVPSSVLLITAAVTQVSADVPTGYNIYSNWEDWARLRRGAQAGLASSYDRSGANEDYSHYEFPEGLVTQETPATVKTIDGPGVIYRFWMPHVMGRRHFVVRMYFDGEQTPGLDTDSTAILDGTFGYFNEPFVTTCAGGQVCYEPIPFSQSLRIETVNKELNTWFNRHYYQYSYITYPAGTAIASYADELTEEQQQSRSAAVSVLENAGAHPAADSPAAQQMSITNAVIVNGGSLEFDITGPGIIRRLNIRMDDANDTELNGLQLRFFYDDAPQAAIDVSVANFFGAGKQRAGYQSLPLGTEANDPNEGFYCYWPMPFRESARMELCNTMAAPIYIDLAKVEYESGVLDRDTCYLHAVENSSTKQSGQIYHTLLSTTGCGHYVGDLLYVRQDVNDFRMLEGDDVITVDGSVTHNGTGLEDAYNGGAYYNWVAVQPDEPEGEYPQSATRPLSGILYVNKEQELARADQYRWRIADCIPFSNSIEIKVECRYAQNGSEWTSVAFWYQLPSPLEDLDADGDVDFRDFAFFSRHWLESSCGECGGADFTGDGSVTADDLEKFVEDWRAGVN